MLTVMSTYSLIYISSSVWVRFKANFANVQTLDEIKVYILSAYMSIHITQVMLHMCHLTLG